MTKAVFTGSFDPVTYGHLDIIKRGLTIFDTLIVGIGSNHSKVSLFDGERRLELLELALNDELLPAEHERVTCQIITGLVAQFADNVGANAILRGVRGSGEFEKESSMAQLNRRLSGIETVIIPTSAELSVVSSSAVKEIAKFGGDLAGFTPEPVANAVLSKLAEIGPG